MNKGDLSKEIAFVPVFDLPRFESFVEVFTQAGVSDRVINDVPFSP